MDIIDGFLPDQTFVALQQLFMGNGSEFPWYYNPFIDYVSSTINGEGDLHNNQMYHWLCRPWDCAISPFADQILPPIMERLNSTKLYSSKVNMQFRSSGVFRMAFHRDVGDVLCRTGVLYMNSTDGPTVFENGKIVECVANRIVLFDSQLLHASTTATNARVRCVINVNCE